ncbi:hypothetical protein CSE16_13530 [Solibacillus sp. R5-41]|uniref:PepSY domain-containing protein n=1 Tax=Solibacillus sp. R5-41 TaxID=2048654 RepID=UPI000C1287E3|nr:PepSY domain-containing protein [Solibacillus sp. R5-41]ATP40992.1 hypothetical protein CSE16_13530 [Solibacillus sp. R5-41]
MKIKQILTIISFIFIGIFIMLAVQQLQTSATLTKEQMTAQVEKVYRGSVQSFIEKDDYYLASFEKNGSTYEVQIDPYNGELSNMQAIFIADKPNVAVKEDDNGKPNTNVKTDDTTKPDVATKSTTNTKPSDTAKPSDNTQKETPPKTIKPLLSEAQAKAIALKEINGQVESVDYNATSDGGYYFIEVEPTNEDRDEVIVQVHAVTGKILLIQYED